MSASAIHVVEHRVSIVGPSSGVHVSSGLGTLSLSAHGMTKGEAVAKLRATVDELARQLDEVEDE